MRDEFTFASKIDSSEDVDKFAIRVAAGARRWPGFCMIGESGTQTKSGESSDIGGRERFRGGVSEASSSPRGRMRPVIKAGDASVGLFPLMKPLGTERGSRPKAWLVPEGGGLGTGSMR